MDWSLKDRSFALICNVNIIKIQPVWKVLTQRGRPRRPPSSAALTAGLLAGSAGLSCPSLGDLLEPQSPSHHPCDLETSQKVCRAAAWDYHCKAFYFYMILLLAHMLHFLNAKVMLILNQLQDYLRRQTKTNADIAEMIQNVRRCTRQQQSKSWRQRYTVLTDANSLNFSAYEKCRVGCPGY